MVGGSEATIFEPSTASAQVHLDPIAPGLDLIPTAYQQIFVDVRGMSILIWTEVSHQEAKPALQRVIDTIALP